MITIIFDWKRTLYDPDKKNLIKGTRDLLVFLNRQHLPVILIGKGGAEMLQETKRLKVRDLFKKIIFTNDKNDAKYFLPFIVKNSPEKTIVIGDRVRSEIELGNQLGATTIWFKQGKFLEETPLNSRQQPCKIVSSLKEIKKIIVKLVNNEKN